MPTRERHTLVPALMRAAFDAPMLDAATERRYLARIRDHDDAEALRRLLASHLRLVVSTARKYLRRGIDMEDLVGEGNLGLLEAVRRFDETKHARFGTYAAWWVRALIRRYAMANWRVVGAPSTRNARRLFGALRRTERRLQAELGVRPTRDALAAELGVSVDDIEMVEAAFGSRDISISARADGRPVDLWCPRVSPEEEVAARELRAAQATRVTAALASLPPRERAILEERILADEASTLRALGTTLGLSRERVRQLQRRACERLRDELVGCVG